MGDGDVMSKAVSTVASILLLVAADWTAARLKRSGLLPVQNHPRQAMAVSVSNSVPLAGSAPQPARSDEDLPRD